MGCFLLNELGEVLLELKAQFNLSNDLCLEVDEQTHTAILKNSDEEFKIDFVHDELMLPLKMYRYLFVVERNNQFYALKSQLAKVVFVG